MFKKRPADPNSIRGLVTSGFFFLACGLGLGYYLLESAPVGADLTAAHLTMGVGVVLAGILWIGAAAKRSTGRS